MRSLGSSKVTRNYLASTPEPCLYVGCGPKLLPGWLNADIDPPAGAVVADARRLPFDPDTFAAVFSEHVIEHLDYGDGVRTIQEAFRVLRPGGSVRISTPDATSLARLVSDPGEPERRYVEALTPHLPAEVRPTNAAVLNLAFRGWGHAFIWDEETLRAELVEAGFVDVRRVDPNDGPDTRRGDIASFESLVVEAGKP